MGERPEDDGIPKAQDVIWRDEFRAVFWGAKRWNVLSADRKLEHRLIAAAAGKKQRSRMMIFSPGQNALTWLAGMTQK